MFFQHLVVIIRFKLPLICKILHEDYKDWTTYWPSHLKKKKNYKEKSYSDGIELPTTEIEFQHANNNCIAILYVNNHGRK